MDLSTEDWSLFPFGLFSAEENDDVLPILGKLAHLSKLRFLPPFRRQEEKHIPGTTGMRVK